MEAYEERMIKEYNELKEKCKKLDSIITKMDACNDMHVECNEILGFKPKCSYGLLTQQRYHMQEYLRILRTRAVIEGVDLDVL